MKTLGKLLSGMPFAAQLNYRDVDDGDAPPTFQVVAIDWTSERVSLKADDDVLTVPFSAVTMKLAGPICGPETFRAGDPRPFGVRNQIIPTTGIDKRFDRLALAIHGSTTFTAEGCVLPAHLATPLIRAYYGKWDVAPRAGQSRARPEFVSPDGQVVSRNAMLKAVSLARIPAGYRQIPDTPGYYVNREGVVLAGSRKMRVRKKLGMPYVRLYTHSGGGVDVNIASLVLRTFRPRTETVHAAHVRWKDGNTLNNRIDNLEYVKAS